MHQRILLCDLTLFMNPLAFSKIAFNWFRKLFSLRCLDLDRNSRSYDSHFCRAVPSNKQIDYSTWIRGSFYPSADGHDEQDASACSQSGDDEDLFIPAPDQLYGSEDNSRRRE
ncbi:hypothetical protein V8B55DRAFT_1417918 [Mucor lusitanicus]|uniref:Uncharacterized protein n=1 Tax=Mucor circinelloides f. lusitanicus TaxID=29924 RepID=A0A8H4B695_MUCCL|nr:hypothetical protein FB192DRAFT_1347943 [Mucor lusitanicus]